jgi:hypothetical protein
LTDRRRVVAHGSEIGLGERVPHLRAVKTVGDDGDMPRNYSEITAETASSGSLHKMNRSNA